MRPWFQDWCWGAQSWVMSVHAAGGEVEGLHRRAVVALLQEGLVRLAVAVAAHAGEHPEVAVERAVLLDQDDHVLDVAQAGVRPVRRGGERLGHELLGRRAERGRPGSGHGCLAQRLAARHPTHVHPASTSLGSGCSRDVTCPSPAGLPLGCRDNASPPPRPTPPQPVAPSRRRARRRRRRVAGPAGLGPPAPRSARRRHALACAHWGRAALAADPRPGALRVFAVQLHQAPATITRGGRLRTADRLRVPARGAPPPRPRPAQPRRL